MKKHKLIIENKKTKINEVEVGIEQILKTSGIGQTAKILNQMFKVAAANVKLLISFVLSFRSTSLKKIAKNIENANSKFSSRVRYAIRDIDKEIEDLARDSKIKEAFAFTLPGVAIIDYLRKETDSAGGFSNYIQSYEQNLYVGDVVPDIITSIEGGLAKIAGVKTNPTSGDDKMSKDEATVIIKKDLEKKLKEKYGQGAVEFLNDIYDGKENDKTIEFLDLINNKKDLTPKDRKNAIKRFLQNFSETVKDVVESKKIFKKTLIVEKNNIKNKRNEKLYSDIVSFVINDIKALDLYFKDKINNKELIKNNIKEDIDEYSNILEFLIVDFFVFNLIENLIQNKNKSTKSISNKIKSTIPLKINKKSKANIDNFFKEIDKEINDKNVKEKTQILLGLIIKIKEDDYYNEENFKKHLQKLNKFCNSSDPSFVELKKLCSKIYKKNISFKIKEAENILKEKVKELDEDSK